MLIVRQSTARTVTIGPVLDASGVAVTTAVVGDFKLSKNGGVPAALDASATLTHRNTGHYSLALTATDLNTVGQAEVVIDATVNGCPIKELTVVEEAVYDAFFAASAPGYIANAPVNVAQFGGTNGTFASGIPSVLLSADYYHADIQFTRDQANTQDEWTVTWFKNGVQVVAGITSPTIQLIKRVDGTDLQAATAMTQVGTTGTYKKDLLTTARITIGEAVLAVAAATIDGSTRSFSRLIGRDSS